MGDVGYNRLKAQQALRFIRDYPREFVSLTAKRVVYFWDGSRMAYRPPTAWYWLPWSFLPLSLLAAPALGMALRRRVYAWQLFLGAFLLYPAPHYLVFSLVRYRHVLEPLLLLLVAYAAREISAQRFPSLGAGENGWRAPASGLERKFCSCFCARWSTEGILCRRGVSQPSVPN